jgi:hypothetical protein
MPHAFTRKRPTGRGSFSWGREPAQDGAVVIYRLFRRDMRRALHAELHTFGRDWDRRAIAARLRQMRHRLRDRVDEIDLHLMGVTQ